MESAKQGHAVGPAGYGDQHPSRLTHEVGDFAREVVGERVESH
jgi:hypothetical protein